MYVFVNFPLEYTWLTNALNIKLYSCLKKDKHRRQNAEVLLQVRIMALHYF